MRKWCQLGLEHRLVQNFHMVCKLICISIHNHYANIGSWVYPDKQLVVVIFHSSTITPMQKKWDNIEKVENKLQIWLLCL